METTPPPPPLPSSLHLDPLPLRTPSFSACYRLSLYKVCVQLKRHLASRFAGSNSPAPITILTPPPPRPFLHVGSGMMSFSSKCTVFFCSFRQQLGAVLDLTPESPT